VVPGKVLSETGTTMMPTLSPGFNEALLAKMCLPRLGEPDDIASFITFLLSPESSWITAQVIAVDGGLTMRE
jgi:NAD(P)-dependent dehydrogenase (short-subunit alcohol dehydrogenase family)